MSMSNRVNNFTVIESTYGRFVVNRYCDFQAEHLIKTGQPHIESELKNILNIVRALPEGCVVVDAGANIGLVSIPIAHSIKERGGVVHSFEVQRMIFYALCGALALNDLDNVFAYRKGLGAVPETLKVPQVDYGVKQDFGAVSLTEQKTAPENEDVEITTVDALGLKRLDFLKIDVEGMDVAVLQGARQALQAFAPWCWVEQWKIGQEPIKQQFAGLDYKFYGVDPLNMLCAPVARLESSGVKIKIPEL